MTDINSAAQEALTVLKNAKVIYTEQEVNGALEGIAKKINQDYEASVPLILCVMNGGLFTTAKLVNNLKIPVNMDYIHATRYENGTEGKALKWLATPNTSLENRDVILVDDILDEGVTLSCLKDYCMRNGANSVKAALLIKKQHDRCINPELGDYIGIEVPDKYVFGCGMDFKGFFRNLPVIYAADL